MRTSNAPRRQALPLRLLSTSLATLFILAGCGGGGGSPGATVSATPPASQQPPATTPPATSQQSVYDTNPSLLGDAFSNYWNLCAKPRTGVDANGKPYPDRQGTLLDELKFLRAWTHQNYLWYNEVPNTYRMADFSNPIDYFDVLKTTALTPSGKPKDQFHFTYPTEEWDAMQNEGVDLGYGLTFSRVGSGVPRTWIVTAVEPGSPADAAGVRRNDMLMRVDGVDFVSAGDNASVDIINAGLFPSSAGTQHRFTFQRSGAQFEVTMTGAEVRVDPVKNVKVIDTASGKVGYLSFETHNAVSEKELVDAFTTFKQEGIADLVLDLRYNGGGLLYVASELAYMVAGPAATAGKVFDRLQYNDKIGSDSPIMFRSTAYGFSAPNPVAAGTALPYLGLKRVTILATSGTCSASEAVINGLRGADIEVIQIGGTTCGKPYGFTPVPNCGTTYFSVEFKGVNDKGFGDYADGFAPTCQASDDLTRAVGDPAEGLLATALAYRTSNACPAPQGQSSARQLPTQLVRPLVKEIAIDRRSR